MIAILHAGLRRPLSFYLTALLIIAIVPSFVFSMIILKRSTDEQDRVVDTLLRASTGSVKRVVERQIDNYVTTLKVLANTRSIEDGNLEEFYGRATSALAGTDSYLLVIDRGYNQLLNTRAPFGTALPKSSDPQTVKRAFDKGVPVVSGVFFGKVAQKWVFNVHLAVSKPFGNGDYVLTLTQNAASLAKAVDPDMLTPGWNAAVIDSDGRTVASSDPDAPVGQPFFMTSLPAPDRVGQTVHDGVEYRTVMDVSAPTGWRIVTWAKSADVEAPALWSYLWLSLGGLLFGGLAVAGSIAIARLLAQGVKVLAQDAYRLGDGIPVKPRKHRIREVETVSAALAQASEARAKADTEIRFLMREVAHRSKNQLTVIQSMLNQSVTAADNRKDFADAFRKRIAGLARSTDLMIANASQGVDMRELAQNQLQPFTPQDPARVRITGPPVRLDSQVSQTLGMALHELATNATKYGALANGRGMVDLRWSVKAGVFLLIWRETGADIAPQTESPRKGFGTMVLERMMKMALGAELERIMHDDGIEWRMTIPQARLNTLLAESG